MKNRITRYDLCPGWFGAQVLYVTERVWITPPGDCNYFEPFLVTRKRKATKEEAEKFMARYRKRRN